MPCRQPLTSVHCVKAHLIDEVWGLPMTRRISLTEFTRKYLSPTGFPVDTTQVENSYAIQISMAVDKTRQNGITTTDDCPSFDDRLTQSIELSRFEDDNDSTHSLLPDSFSLSSDDCAGTDLPIGRVGEI